MVLHIVKEVRDIKRFKEILVVLFEEGFDFLIEKIKLKHKVPLTKRVKKRLENKKKHSLEKRLRLTLERLGPTFIKFGQVLSVRPDLVPKSYIIELEKLQDEVSPFPYSQVKEQIKNELGGNPENIFSRFDKTPIASASISQVHKAILKNGKRVAVKIQRPDIVRQVETDIEIMLYVAKLLERHIPKIRRFTPIKVIEEFSRWTEKELDFKREAINAKRFYRNFSGSKTVKIPKIYDKFTTNKIIVMEFIDGIELHNIKEAKKRKINIKKMVDLGFETILTQIFEHGFFHADPHPGNILITKDKKIALVDFGIVGHFDENLKNKSIDLFYGIIKNDADKVVDTLIELNDSEIENKEEFKDDINEVLESFQSGDRNKIKVSRTLEEIQDISYNYGLRLPMPFVLFGKTVITLEGIALQYDPKFKIIESSKPLIEKLVMRRYNPVNTINTLTKNLLKLKKYSEDIPEQASKALKKIEKGSFKVDIDDTDIKQLSSELDKSSNRIAYSMLIAAFLVVAALTINFGKPIIYDMPFISVISFSIAVVLLLILIFSILRNKLI